MIAKKGVASPGDEAVEFKHDQALKPGATLKTFRTFVCVHRGDYFQTLRD